ncbi:MAG: hypothetical protein OEX11_02905 [Nitrosomonas sp.]|nr:hypothetical protein [Nitrosomonas sp.]
MKKTLSLNLLFLIIASLLFLIAPTASAESPLTIFKDGKFYGDFRYRYEHVDQAGFSNDATASTFRSRFGLVSGEYRNFQASVELDSVGTIGSSRYNSGINGKGQFPVVPDPRTNELNALWLSWNGLQDTNVKLGRQPINLDNQRFIGTVGFRQNDQTYDSVTLNNRSIKNLHLFYSYTDQVNRIFGHKHPAGVINANLQMGRAEYEFLPSQKIIAYTYWLDFERALPSSKTYGIRLVGKAPVTDEINILYLAEVARQHDLSNAVNDYSATYFNLSGGAGWRTFTLEVGAESLGGNGTSAFSTPLSTLHAHNGWADKFLVTPVNGLQDIYVKGTYKASGINKWVDNTVVQLFYHDFNSERGNADYGTEWNVDITKVFTEREMMPLPIMKAWSVGLRFADYNAQTHQQDTRKGWFTLGARF